VKVKFFPICLLTAVWVAS